MSESAIEEVYTVRCCGEDRRTPFCPLCGKEIAPEASVLNLLAYLSANAGKARKDLEEIEPGSHKHDSKKKTLDKWGTWEVGLKRLIDFYEEHRPSRGSQE